MWLAWHYPLGSTAAVAGVLVLGAAMFWQPWLWLVLVPGLLPLIGWAPWSGWITFEELDILVLTASAVGYARLAFWPFVPHALVDKGYIAIKSVVIGGLFVGLFGLSTLGSLGRGLADAGGFSFGWFQGYHEPMNSVRLAKSLFLALLLWPLWRAQCRHSAKTPWGPVDASTLVSVGMALGLTGAALTTVWERVAFTALLNFSADYRTTGMFWEMHVGGAALDGYLALTVPFAVQQLLVARRPWHWAGAGMVLGLGAYSCLTTFSRGVYLAIPVGLAVMLWLNHRQQKHLKALQPTPAAVDGEPSATVAGVAVVALYAVTAAWIFPTSGYRGALALMGALVELTLLAHWVKRLRLTAWVGAALVTAMLAVVVLGAYAVEGKASYVSFALGFLGCTAAVLWAQRHASTSAGIQHKRSSTAPMLGMAFFGATVLAAGLIFHHWGGEVALLRGLPVLLLLFLALVWLGMSKRHHVPNDLRWQAVVAGGLLMTLTTVGVFSGGDYIDNRFSTGREDLGVRLQHWRQGLGMLEDGQELLLGKGLGRYPAAYFLDGPQAERVGDYRWLQSADGAYLVLSAGLHQLGDAEMLRISQRVSVPQGTVMLSVDMKATQDVPVAFEVCGKHLLYTDYACLRNTIGVKANGDKWQHFAFPLQGNALSRGDWYAPKLLVFSAMVIARGHVVAIDNLHLRDATGTELLANADFSQGLAHWFMSSDRNHLPWHIKSMPLNIVFDQGVLGLMLWLGMVAVALWRLSLGAAQSHPLAPAIAGAITGFCMVGLFDSLLDVPRVAFLFYFLLLMALTRYRPQ